MGDGEAVIREVWRRWNAGEREYDSEVVHPDAVVLSALTGAEFRGEEGVRAWIDEIDDQFEEWQLWMDEVEEVSPDVFLVRGGVRARGRHSGLHLDQPITWLVEVRDGRILRLRNYMGPDADAAARRELGSGQA